MYDVPKKVRMSAEVKKIEEKLEKDAENKEKDTKNAEKEDAKEEEVDELKEEPKKSIEKRIKEQWQLILKIVELVICALCFGFVFTPVNRSENILRQHLDQVAVVFSAFVGYMIINMVLIIARILKDKIPFRISSLFSLVAWLLFFLSGILLSVDKQNKFSGIYPEPHRYLVSMLYTATILSFINSIFFAVDGVYTFILKEDF